MIIIEADGREEGEEPVSKHQIQPGWMSGLTRDGKEPTLSRATKISGASGDSEISISPDLQLTTSRLIGNHID